MRLWLLGKTDVFVWASKTKKHAILISREESSKMITYTSKQNCEQHVSEIVQDPNLFMGGVDLSNMCIYIFIDEKNY